MSSSQALAVTPNPLTELPVLGGVVGLADKLLIDLGIPLWLAETLELVGLCLLLTILVGLAIRKALPWLAQALAPVVSWLLDHLAMILLVPEFAATRIRTRAGRPPPTAAYSYGDGVLGFTAAVKSSVHSVLEVLPRASRAPRSVPVSLVVLFVLVWNNEACASTPLTPACVSPATHWVNEADSWFRENG